MINKKLTFNPKKTTFLSLQRQSYFSVSSVGVPIRNIADYSPFGVQLDGRTIQGDFYRRGFNGMEKDDEVKGGGNSYDFGARMYDARVGRWLTIDPLARKYVSNSPYNFVNNMPINAIDPDGERIIIVNGYYNTREIAESMGSSECCRLYWNANFESRAQEFFGDYTNSTQWIDGNTIGGLASGKANFNAGYEYAKENFASLTKGMSEDEVFNIVGHSMGAAFSAGIAQYIKDDGRFKVENIVLLSAHKPGEFSVPKGINSYQIGYEGDPIVQESQRAGNVKTFGVVERDDLSIQHKHGTTKNGDVFNELKDLKTVSFSKTNLTYRTFEVNGPNTTSTKTWSVYKPSTTTYNTNFTVVRNNIGEVYKKTIDNTNFYRPHSKPLTSKKTDHGAE